MVRKLALLAFCFSPFFLQAQRIDNVRAQSIGDQIIVNYDLVGSQEGQEFRIELYSSVDNFATAVFRVTGDVGPRVRSGTQRRIIWDSKAELTDYKGAVTLEIRGEPLAALPTANTNPTSTQTQVTQTPVNNTMNFRSPSGGSVKRGKPMTISWTGGVLSDNITLDLLKGGARDRQLSQMTNIGSYQWSVPPKMDKGYYQVRLQSPGGEITSAEFQIKPKIPLVVKVLPAVAIVAVLVVILTGGDDKGDDLPTPPDVPEN